jgi:limonene-1,2-epoxide hydrolase
MSKENGEVVSEFVSRFAAKDADQLVPYLHPDVVFEAYGDTPVKGREGVVALWRAVFGQMGAVDFSTLHQAVDGEMVLAEQIHGLALPGRKMADIRNVAVYRVRDGLIVEWRDYTNPGFARTLM